MSILVDSGGKVNLQTTKGKINANVCPKWLLTKYADILTSLVIFWLEAYLYYKHFNENRNHSQSSSEAKLVVEANLLLTY